MAEYNITAENSLVSGTKSADNFWNDGRDGNTLDAGAGNDTINNTGSYVSINAGDGNDTIHNHSQSGVSPQTGGDHTTIHGGAGNDSINNYQTSLVAIFGDEGDDIIKNDAAKVTLRGGTGNDTINFEGATNAHQALIQYAPGDGDDLIIGNERGASVDVEGITLTETSDTIQLLDGADITGGWIADNQIDLVLQVGEGSITFTKAVGKGYAKKLNILRGNELDEENLSSKYFRSFNISNEATDVVLAGEELNDTITNSGKRATINADAGSDDINNSGDNVLINAGIGNDDIYNSGERATINGGAGDDSIISEGARALLNGDDGDDYIRNEGMRATVSGGEGDDLIENLGAKSVVKAGAGDDIINLNAATSILYKSGDGNDEIVGYEDNSTIKITEGAYNGSSLNGNDVVLKIGAGSITVRDAVGKIITVVDANENVITIEGGSFNLVNNSNDTVVNGTSGAEKISNVGSNVTIDAKAGDDFIQNTGANVSINAGAGNDRILDKSEGASTINGGEGSDTIELSNDAGHVIEYAAGDDVIVGYGESDSIKILGGDFDEQNYRVDGRDIIFDIDDAGTLTIKNGVGVKISFIDADDEEIVSDYFGPREISNFNERAFITATEFDDTVSNYAEGVTINGDAGADIVRNEGMLSSIGGSAGDDTITNAGMQSTVDGGVGADYIINTGSHAELNGGAGDDHIVNNGRRATINGGEGDDLIEGAQELAEMYIFSGNEGNDTITNFGRGDSLRIDGTVQSRGTVESGDYVITVRKGTKTGTVTLHDAVSNRFNFDSGSNVLTFYDTSNDVKEIYNSDANATIDVGYDANNPYNYYIVNSGRDVTVRGGGGNDTMEGSDLYGETFVFDRNSGNDVIVNFRENDTLRALNGTLSFNTVEGTDDVIVTIAGSSTNTFVTLQGAAGLDLVKNGRILSVLTEHEIENATPDIKLAGTLKDDNITNTGNHVSIEGRAGNDTIDLSDFGEMILFGAADGRDEVFGFDVNDTLKITQGSIQSQTRLGDDYVVIVKSSRSSSSITLKDVFKGNDELKFKTIGNALIIDEINDINNYDDNTVVSGTEGRDWITNSGSNVTIAPGSGNDTVEGSDNGEVFAFSNFDGRNVVANFATNDTLRATSGTITAVDKIGDDYVVMIEGDVSSSFVTLLDAGSSNISIDSEGKNLRIASDEIEPIVNPTPNRKFSGTADADYMINTGDNVTIQGNKGDDTITGSETYGERFQVASNHGSDVITNFGKNDTLQCTGGNIASYWVEGNDVIVSLKGATYQDTVRLQNAADYEFIQKGNILTVKPDIKTIYSSYDNQKLVGSSNTEVFIIEHDHVSVEGKGGQDTIYASNQPDTFRVSSADLNGNVIVGFGEDDTIHKIAGNAPTWATVEGTNDVLVSIKGASYAGDYLLKDVADKDYQWIYKNNRLYVDTKHDITVGGNNEKVNGTGGRDYIINPDYEGITVQANGGTDTIVGSEAYGEVFVFANTDGGNLIQGFEAKDTLVMSNAGTMSGAVSGDDYIITIEGSNDSIATVTLEGAAGLDFIQDGATLSVVQPLEPMYNYTDGILFSANTDKGAHMINSGARVSMQAGGGNDTMEGSDLYGEMFLAASNTGNNVITNFGKNDSLKMTSGTSITWATVGADVVVTLGDKKYKGYETLLGAAGLELVTTGSVLHANVTSEIGNTKNDYKVNGSDNGDVIFNSGSNVTIESKGGNDTIYGSAFGEQFNFSSADENNLVIGFDAEDTLRATGGKIENVTKVGEDVVVALKGARYSGAVTLEGAGYLIDKLTVNSNKNLLTVDSVATIVNREDSVKVDGTSGRDLIINVGEHVSIAPGAGVDTITGSDYYGDVFLLSSADDDNIITNFNANDTLRCTAGKIVGITTVGDDVLVTLKGSKYMGVETLLGAAGLTLKKSGSNLIAANVTMKRNSKSNTTFKGTSGDDWLVNSGSGVTISSGAGNDTIEGSDEYGELYLFASNTGDNVVLNFRSNDTLKCTAGSIASFETVGNDVFVSLKGAVYSGSVLLKDAAGLEFVQNGKFLTAKGGVNAISNDRDGIKVVGSSGDDWIVNSGMNASIEGKAGNDTIEAGNLAETFLFSSADDDNVIVGFDVDDTLKVTAGKLASFETIGNDVFVSLKGAKYSGSVTLLDAAGLNFKKSGSNLIVDADAEPIFNRDDGKKVNGTDKGEKIINVGENVTIEGKGGDDTIYGSDVYGEVFTFAASDGGDNLIVNFHENDTLRATKGTITSNVISGDDCVITIAEGKASITVTLQDVGKNGFQVSGDKTILCMFDRSNTGSSSEMPAGESDYWFLDDGTNDEAQTLNEIVSTEAALDLDDPTELLTTFDGSARSDKMLATFARHRSANK